MAESSSPPSIETPRKKVAFISLGCPKNTVDTEVMIRSCADSGYEIVDSIEGSDTVVVNTCGFIQSAKEESIDTILEMLEARKAGVTGNVVVTGCLSQRYGEELRVELPDVAAFLGTEQQTELPRILKVLSDTSRQFIMQNPGKVPVSFLRRHRVTPRHWAYLKISEGCDQTCTFCAIPQFRGKFRSKSLEDIVAEGASLVEEGARELILISQETASYGKDLPNERNLSMLLEALGELEGLEWIRLMYLFPKNISDKLIRTIADHPKVVPYVDIPFQHCSDEILKRMGRQQTNAFLRDLVARFRRNIPGVALRTTLMVGFPGETEQHFQELVDFVEECEFEHLGVFKYSEEDNTAATRFPDDVPEEVKEERKQQLLGQQMEVTYSKHADLLGEEVEVMVDGISDESDDLLQGRMKTQAPEIDGVVYIGDGFAKPGDLVRVQITDTHTYDVAGRIVEHISTARVPGLLSSKS